MTRPSDVHYALLTDATYDAARTALRAVADLPVVLSGGWAVFSHVPRVPSVDVDVFVPRREAHRVRDALARAGVRVGAHEHVELLDFDGRIEAWGFGDPDLGIPEPAYVPSALFRNRTMTLDVTIAGDVLPVTVPDRAVLAVTKLVALRNRDLAYRAHTSGQARMLLGPALIPRVLHQGESYYHRKAGKDLFDLGLLLMNPEASAAARVLLDDCDLAEVARVTIADLHEDTRRLASDFANRSESPDVVRVTETFADSA